MLVKVCKHGNSLSIRLGAYVTRTARIKCGDWVDVVLLSSGEIRIKPKTGPEPLEADGEAVPTAQAIPVFADFDQHARLHSMLKQCRNCHAGPTRWYG